MRFKIYPVVALLFVIALMAAIPQVLPVRAQDNVLAALPDNAVLIYGRVYEYSTDYDGLAHFISKEYAVELEDLIRHSTILVDDIYDAECDCWIIDGVKGGIQWWYELTYDVPEIRGSVNYRVWMARLPDGIRWAVVVSHPSNTRTAEDLANDDWHCASSSLLRN